MSLAIVLATPAASPAALVFTPNTTTPEIVRANVVSCPSTSFCAASDGSSVMIRNGGSSWTQQAITGPDARGISCADGLHCWIVGYGGNRTSDIVGTSDGGATWSQRNAGDTQTLEAISCPSATQCVAVGDNSDIRTTTDGGSTWVARSPGVSVPVISGVACPSTTRCWAVGYDGAGSNGIILASADGGVSWSVQRSGITGKALRVSCPTTTTCYVLGSSVGLMTTNAGATWTSVPAMPRANNYQSLSCPAANECYVAGYDGNIAPVDYDYVYITTDSGATWSHAYVTQGEDMGISCPASGMCWTVGQPGFTSGPVTGQRPDAQTGYAGSITMNSATLVGTFDPQGQPTSTSFQYGTSISYGLSATGTDTTNAYLWGSRWSSAAINGLLPATTYHFRLVATNDTGTTYGSDQTFTTNSLPGSPSVDSNSGACSSAPGNQAPGPHPLVNAAGVRLDTFFSSGSQASVCASAPGVNERVVVPLH